MFDENMNSLSSISNEEAFQEEAFCKIFRPILEPMDIKDEINPDKVYFVKSKNEINYKNLNYEDFDEFYKIFFGENGQNEIREDNSNIHSCIEKPSFFINFSKDIIFYCFENEKLLNVLNIDCNNEIKCKDKVNKDFFEEPENLNKDKEIKNFIFTPSKGIISGYSLKLSDETNKYENNTQTVPLVMSEYGPISESNIDASCLNTQQIIHSENVNYDFKFKTKKYCIMPNGKKRREKKKRKYKSDDIRKKIKSRFHKTLKNIINDLLKSANSKKLLDFLPQCFVGNISKKINGYCLELSYKDLYSINFISELSKDKEIENHADYKKFLRNKEVIEYLESNPEIRKESNFDLIMNTKYKDLLKMYFSSGDFENSLIRLKQENESNDYIQEYIYRAKNYVDFFCNNISCEKNDIESNED